uniref:HAT C-terminal dimerisation domain-containing protein n=1 Tax=Trichuris muris TaxID=70415 RepID=A0A5S6QI82_TRIMR
MSCGEFYNFPNLCELRNKGQISEEDIEVYWRHLESLHQDFIERFQDIFSLEVPDWVMNPLSGVENAEVKLQEELLELQVNEELKPKFKLGYRTFWLQRDISRLYPRLWPIVRNLLISFPSSYLVERGFSVVADLLTKKRNKL